MVKLKFYFMHISYLICTMAMPKNIFYASGEKCVIIDPAVLAFKQNPYVIDMDDAE